MFCRNCGNEVADKAVVCVSCGLRPLTEQNFCQECGGETKEDQEICLNCGCRTQSKNSNYQIKQKNTQASVQHGGFFRRLAALIIDIITIEVSGLVIGFPIGFIIGLIMIAMGYLEHEIVAFAESVGLLLSLVISWLYFTIMESSKQQATLGKMALGLKVVDIDSNRISFARANGRYFAKIISAVTLFIGFIMAAFTKNKQAMHDRITDTYVSKFPRGVNATNSHHVNSSNS
ncbi:RDD family protein [Proteinivorax hydrogeniformans]|uniref:RDD family protein n=1 Tax=Proteinivorax hydrogeniformans TaxID=1826727 RepID=A0AAU8HVE8_9FIRM